jgi:hypothetical protein
MIVICSPPGEPVRRCAVVGEDSGRGLFCSRDVAAGGEEVTAVVGWVRLPVTLAFTALASVVALPTTVAAGAVTCGQRGRKAEAGWMLHWAEVDGIGEGEAWSLARLELENREGGVTNTRGGLSDAGRSPNAAGARRGGVVVNRAVSRGGRRGGSVRRVGLSRAQMCQRVMRWDIAGMSRSGGLRVSGARCMHVQTHALSIPSPDWWRVGELGRRSWEVSRGLSVVIARINRPQKEFFGSEWMADFVDLEVLEGGFWAETG